MTCTITLSEIQRDRLTKIAEVNWSKAAGWGGKDSSSEKRFDSELVMILEVSQYLENYLWPNFDPDAAQARHVDDSHGQWEGKI